MQCGRPSRVYTECCPECLRERTAVCMRYMKHGHTTQDCQDQWRCYHLTTTESAELTRSAAEPKPLDQLFCCNCAERGHLVSDCKDLDRSKYPAAPCNIFSYEDPTRFLDEVTDGGQTSINISSDRKSVGSPPPQSASRLRVLGYTIYPRDKISVNRIRFATNQVSKDVNHVDIVWQRQSKNGTFIVEFKGNGDKQEARRMFKELVHLQGKETSLAAQAQTPQTSNQQVVDANSDAAGSSGVDRDNGL